MWALANTTPFPARVSAFRAHTGASFWALWLKASFEMRPDRPAMFLSDQPPLVVDPVFEGERLLFDTDLSQPKPRVDLLIAGEVTPDASGPRTLTARIADQTIACDVNPQMRKNWRKMWVPDEKAPVHPAPLDVRSALGGMDEDADATDNDTPPVLTPVGQLDARAPAHFGPVAPTAPSRARYGGTYDAAWQADRAPLLPADFDPAYWQTALPQNQLNRPVDPAAPLELSGFGDSDGTYPLPHLALHCATRIASVWHTAPAELQSLSIDLPTRRLSLTYLACWPITAASADVDISRTSVKLDRWDMFRVRPSDVGHFAPSAQIREAV